MFFIASISSILASRDECPGSLCHSSGVHVGVGCMDKNFNLCHNFPTITERDLILHMCIPCDKTFHLGTIIFDPVTLTLKFDLLLKNFNLGHNIHSRRDRAFIFHMCIPCDKTFYMVS